MRSWSERLSDFCRGLAMMTSSAGAKAGGYWCWKTRRREVLLVASKRAQSRPWELSIWSRNAFSVALTAVGW